MRRISPVFFFFAILMAFVFSSPGWANTEASFADMVSFSNSEDTSVDYDEEEEEASDEGLALKKSLFEGMGWELKTPDPEASPAKQISLED